MKEVTFKFRRTEYNLLEWLLWSHIKSDEYYGNKKQHQKMCQELFLKLRNAEAGQEKAEETKP